MDPQAFFDQAAGLHRAGRLDDAVRLYDQLLAQFPDHADTVHLRGLADLHRGRFADAERWLARAVEIMPDFVAAHANRAAALIALGRHEDAAASAERALARDPASLSAANNLASALLMLDRAGEALAVCDQALGRGAEDARIHIRRAEALIAARRNEEALAACECAIALDPSLPEAHGHRAFALTRLRRHAEAAESYGHALTLAPDSPEGHCSHALALFAKKAPLEAIASCNRALALRPNFADALLVRAKALEALKRHDEAIADCDAALALMPDSGELFALRGLAFQGARRPERALADFEIAVDLDPELDLVPGERAFLCLQTCDWEGLSEKIGGVLAAVDAGKYAVQPFVLTALPSTPAQQLAIARQAFRAASPDPVRAVRQARPFNSRLRVAYFSSDLHDHPVGQLLVGMLEAHDRARFEVVGFAFGGDPLNATRRRIERACDRFVDSLGMSGAQMAALAREMNVHIAVDLNGYTAFSRPEVFADGAAPVQVNFLGYPGTMGTARMHYIIGDRIVTPPEHYPFFDERIVTMPHAYLVANDIKRHVPARLSTRAELGLPDAGFVFSCFNAPFKITPEAFDVWMRLLAAVEGSVLWLNDAGPTAVRNLRREAQARGVAPGRLVFAPRTPGLEYLARYRVADLFLDTFTYNAHATASEALMVGLPVVTRLGPAFAGRVAASLLTAIGLPELVADTAEDYEAIALGLARDPARLAVLRDKLARLGAASPLFDTARYTRNIESAYAEMWRRCEAGLAPDHITVADTGA